jgi:hypothetical protein
LTSCRRHQEIERRLAGPGKLDIDRTERRLAALREIGIADAYNR